MAAEPAFLFAGTRQKGYFRRMNEPLHKAGALEILGRMLDRG